MDMEDIEDIILDLINIAIAIREKYGKEGKELEGELIRLAYIIDMEYGLNLREIDFDGDFYEFLKTQGITPDEWRALYG